MSRTFPLSVAVSVVHNRLVCPFDTYREFLDYLVGHHVALWDVNKAREAAAAAINKRHPELAKLPPPEKTDSGNANKYVRTVAAKVGYDTITMAPFKSARVPDRTHTQALKELR